MTSEGLEEYERLQTIRAPADSLQHDLKALELIAERSLQCIDREDGKLLVCVINFFLGNYNRQLPGSLFECYHQGINYRGAIVCLEECHNAGRPCSC